MPIMDGYQVSQGIREFYCINEVAQPLIIACTGHVEEEFIKEAWLNDIDEVIPKPVNVDILAEIIDEIIIHDYEQLDWLHTQIKINSY